MSNKKISKSDLVFINEILTRNFEEEGMFKFFDIDKKYEHISESLNLDRSNSIKLDFKGFGSNHKYHLLFVTALFSETEFNHDQVNELSKILNENIDKIVIWVNNQLPTNVFHTLKNVNTNIIYFDEKEFNSVSLINHFLPIRKISYEKSVRLNKLSNLIIKRLKKLFHIVLSEIAADSYDEEYGKEANIGTQAIMEYEEEIIGSIVSEQKHEPVRKGKKIAIDVGCGTGRHAFNICEDYERVFGFDFSPKMIEKANQKKRQRDINNVTFSVADLEYEEILYENEFKGNVDLIIVSFGMGSFIEDTKKILRRYNEWLKPGGKIVFSFYNSRSIILEITPNWRDTSLAAHIDTETNTLQVKLSDDVIFQIFCKPFDTNVESMVRQIFDLDKLHSYPTTMALLPNSLLKNSTAYKRFKQIDLEIAQNKDFFNGHYVLVEAQKPLYASRNGYDESMKVLKDKEHEIIDHNIVLSVKDVIEEIGINKPENMLKTIVLYDRKHKLNVVVLMPSSKNINSDFFVKELDKLGFATSHNNLKMATEKQIMKLGYPVGGIGPLGYPNEPDIIKFIDEEITKLDKQTVLYTGVGDNKKTLKIKLKSLTGLIKDYKPTTIPNKR